LCAAREEVVNDAMVTMLVLVLVVVVGKKRRE
jgi:hypothetical protein